MTLVTAFSYSDIKQRRLLLADAFMSAAVLFFILFSICCGDRMRNICLPADRYFILSLLLFLVPGAVLGRFLFRRIKATGILLFMMDIIAAVPCAAYVLRFLIFPAWDDSFFLLSPYTFENFSVFAGLFSFLAGIKFSCLLKTACGDFIDEKNTVIPFFITSMAGSFAGTAGSFLFIRSTELWKNPAAAAVLICCILFTAALSFLFRLEYMPGKMYAKNFIDESSIGSDDFMHRDDFFCRYLNISFILTYLFLGYTVCIKFYGSLWFSGILFAAVSAMLIYAGFLLGRLIPENIWSVFSEMFFPLCFVICLFLMYLERGHVPVLTSALFFMPLSLVMGINLHQAVSSAVRFRDQEKRFRILFLSAAVIPACVMTVLSFISFSETGFFVFLYILSAVNLIIPMYTLLKKTPRTHSRDSLLCVSFSFIPVLIFTHLILHIPLNSSVYVSVCRNYEELQKTDFSGKYIKNRCNIEINGIKAFTLSDYSVKNMKRQVLPILLFSRPGNVLVLDGNFRFYENPLLAEFNNPEIISTLPARMTDYQELPENCRLSGLHTETMSCPEIIRKGKKYSVIADMPSVLDTQTDSFRFSSEFMKAEKDMLEENGLFAEALNIRQAGIKALSGILLNIESFYRYQLVFIFSDTAVILASDSQDTLKITNYVYKKISDFQENPETKGLFFSQEHFLSCIAFTDVSMLMKYADIYGSRETGCIKPELYSFYTENSSIFTDLTENRELKNYLSRSVAADQHILSLLKKAFLAGSMDQYVAEMEYLFSLCSLSGSSTALHRNLKELITCRKEHYFEAASFYEKKKDWGTAWQLYEAILATDKDSFEANYRLGILSLTLQDMESAFKYLNHALTLRKDDPDAQTEFGILLFSTGKPEESLNWLRKAMARKPDSPRILFYTGLVCEELNRNQDAREYYMRALKNTPDDQAVISSLKSVDAKIAAERDRWKYTMPTTDSEVEIGEKIPLPINKSAFEVRLDYEDRAEEKDRSR